MRERRWTLPSSLALAALMLAPAAAQSIRPLKLDEQGPPLAPSIRSPLAALNTADPEAQRAAAPRLKAAPICNLIATSADRNGLPRAFLARLIWKESRFDTRAVSPVGARGIAQFMPATARQEGLANPFDPYQAIPVAAKHLADMRRRFGNLGLAAIGYNAGPGRVEAYTAGNDFLPMETRNYVASILGRDASAYREGATYPIKPLKQGVAFHKACGSLPVMRTSIRGPIAVRAKRQPWHVQVSRHFARHVAINMFKRAQKRHSDILGSLRPVVVTERGRAGTRPQKSVRVGQPSRKAAGDLCRRLRNRGAFCLVKKNEG